MNLEYSDWNDTNSLAVAQKGKPAIYINNQLSFDKIDDSDERVWEFIKDFLKSIIKDEKTYHNCLSDLIFGGLFFFENIEEAQEFFNILNQDASPIFAVLYDSTGKCLTENT